jgi:hypothetical protein
MPHRLSRIPPWLSRKDDRYQGHGGGPTLSSVQEDRDLLSGEGKYGLVFRYYGCPSCGHLWGFHKDHPRLLFHVTPLPSKPDASPVE